MRSLKAQLRSEYNSYCAAKSRCTNPDDQAFADYGGRGIEFHFENFEEFIEHVGPRPEKHQLDREDNKGHYEPGNVRWVTKKVNCRNTRRNRFITFRGETKTAVEWSEVTGINRKTIVRRLNNGWSVERTLTTPSLVKYANKRPTCVQDSVR